MEMEFDKEIDALLRRSPMGISLPGEPHLDADTIAAFAENALPAAARQVYTRHLADCEHCRKLLSDTIILNRADGVQASSDAVIGTALSAPAESWWSRLFRTPGIALAMAAVVIAFAGAIGYIAVINRNAGDSTMAKAEPQGPNNDVTRLAANRPPSDTISAANVGNTAANAASNAAVATDANSTPAANASVQRPSAPANAVPVYQTPSDNISEGGSGRILPDNAPQPTMSEMPRVGSAPPMIESPAPITKNNADEKTADGDIANRDELPAGSVLNDRSLERRDKQALKTNRNGPARAMEAVPRKAKSDVSVTDGADMRSETRSAGGHSFISRNGVWYDTAYKGGSITSVKRDSSRYRSLDDGLRSIADKISGAVVIVWKGKNYKID